MISLLNLGSIVLGLIALILPVVNIMRFKKYDQKNLSIMSISACAISLLFQIFYNYHLVKIGDWSALMDTMGAVTFVAAVLLFITIALNVIALIAYRGKIAKVV